MNYPDFLSIASKYKVVFFDAYGVLKTHEGVLPRLRDTLQALTDQGILFYVLTNDASRSPQKLAESYQKVGVLEISEENLISSGMLAREYLQDKVEYGTVAYIGTPQSAHYVESVGLKVIPIQEVDLTQTENVNALVLLDDEGFSWEQDINKAVNLLRKRNMPVIVANSDRTYPISKGRVSIAIGGLANMIEQMVSKKFLRFGKPDTQIFHFAHNLLKKRGVEVSKREMLMVGDTLLTDILGGNKYGLDTMLVLTGNTQPDRAQSEIQSTGIIPTYICESVVAGIAE